MCELKNGAEGAYSDEMLCCKICSWMVFLLNVFSRLARELLYGKALEHVSQRYLPWLLKYNTFKDVRFIHGFCADSKVGELVFIILPRIPSVFIVEFVTHKLAKAIRFLSVSSVRNCFKLSHLPSLVEKLLITYL